MKIAYDSEALRRILIDFHTLTGLRAVVFDAAGLDMLSYPTELPAFCRMVRAAEGGEQACLICDQNACMAARKEQKTLIYACHAGLIEAIAPIVVDHTVAGYLLLSHIVQGADEAAELQAAQNCCARYGLAPEQVAEAFGQLPRTPYARLRAAADILTLAAQAIYQQKLAQLVPGSPEDQLNEFLQAHLADELTSETICQALSISRTTLYHLAKRAYGCGICEQVTRLRIRRAMELLSSSDRTNAEICKEIGIADYNYFFRLFKKETGMTPRTYREQIVGSGTASAARGKKESD